MTPDPAAAPFSSSRRRILQCRRIQRLREGSTLHVRGPHHWSSSTLAIIAPPVFFLRAPACFLWPPMPPIACAASSDNPGPRPHRPVTRPPPYTSSARHPCQPRLIVTTPGRPHAPTPSSLLVGHLCVPGRRLASSPTSACPRHPRARAPCLQPCHTASPRCECVISLYATMMWCVCVHMFLA